jgi:putative radical SAM enzyme (TIGR03279 family)
VRAEHDRPARRHGRHVVDEDHAQPFEAFDHQPVVDDLVIAVHGRLEGPNHPGERLDRHFDSGAEASRRGEQHAIDGHQCRLVGRSLGHSSAVSLTAMSSPRVVAVAPGSPAARAGMAVGDEIVAINGTVPRDVIEYRFLTDEPDLVLDVNRGGIELAVELDKAAGEPLGVEVHSALFDQVRTCDNHCAFCFIYQLPPGLRRSLYVKDDDYRLSFLYGNFTTLTRFTESDLERVVTERLSPLHVSIHAVDPEVRSVMLRNRRGATSLRWLRALLDHGIEVHGQVVVCPDVNNGAVLDDTLAGVLDRFPELATLCVVPLGVSRWTNEPSLRPHTAAEAAAVVDAVEDWQDVYLAAVGRRLAHAADEYYLLAGRPFPAPEAYEGFPMHEDGVGMARTFELEFTGAAPTATGVQAGFFAWVDSGGDGEFEAYRGPRAGAVAVALRPRRSAPVGILTGNYGARVLAPLIATLDRDDVRILPVANEFFGGNIGVAGLLCGPDLARTLAGVPEGHRYLLPDVCLSQGRFLDGSSPADLPRPVEVVATEGHALRAALEP